MSAETLKFLRLNPGLGFAISVDSFRLRDAGRVIVLADTESDSGMRKSVFDFLGRHTVAGRIHIHAHMQRRTLAHTVYKCTQCSTIQYNTVLAVQYNTIIAAEYSTTQDSRRHVHIT